MMAGAPLVRALPVVAALFALMAVGHEAVAERAGNQKQVTSSTALSPPAVIELLPSLKSHMARMGSLMNFLFRHIDEPDRSPELLEAIDELREHLRLSRRFTPFSLASLADARQEFIEATRYKTCLDDADASLKALQSTVRAGTPAAAKSQLLELDRIRRDCHSAFG